MRIDNAKMTRSNFNATGKDLYKIMEKMLANQNLLKLLKYSTPDALTSKRDLTEEEKSELVNKNIKVVPQLPIPEEEGSFIIVAFDGFVTNENNPEFRDNMITFDVLCFMDCWIMNDYMLRPYKIMHEIDEMFNNSKLNGIGKVDFISANSLILSSELAGFTMVYRVVNDV